MEKNTTHTVNFSIKIGDQLWHEAKDKLPDGIYQDIETKRELAIMHEIMNSEGKTLDEKIDNTLDKWYNEEGQTTVYERYKLKYKY